MSSASSVWEFSRAFLGDADGDVIVLRVFMDESGTHGESPVLTVGAAWAKPSAWKRWTKDWNVAKKPIKVHHSTYCHNRTGEYEGWCRPKRDDYVKRILPVIAEHRINGRVAGLHVESYRKGISTRPEVAAAFGDPYIACFQWVISDICELALAAGHHRLAFVHEQNSYETAALKAFSNVRRRFPMMTLTIAFACKAKYVPLQCADVFAFEGNRRLRDTHAPVRKPMEAIDPEGERVGFIEYDEYNMGEFVTTMCRLFDDLRSGQRVVL